MENESVPGEHPYLPPIAVVHLEHILAGPNPNLYLAAALDERYATVGEPLPLRYEFTWQHLNRGRYAEEALIQGAINCIDPRSGAFVVSKCAYVLEIDCWLCIAYEFDGVDRFFLITGSFDQAKLGIFFPDSSLLVVGQVELADVEHAHFEAHRLVFRQFFPMREALLDRLGFIAGRDDAVTGLLRQTEGFGEQFGVGAALRPRLGIARVEVK